MLNKFILQGRLTADPEIGNTQSGVCYVNFTVAWSKKYKESDSVLFQKCKAWRGTAEFIGKYFIKGQEIAVIGELVTESWETDGQKRSENRLYVDEVHFCGRKAETDSSERTENVPPPITVTENDRLPF